MGDNLLARLRLQLDECPSQFHPRINNYLEAYTCLQRLWKISNNSLKEAWSIWELLKHEDSSHIDIIFEKMGAF